MLQRKENIIESGCNGIEALPINIVVTSTGRIFELVFDKVEDAEAFVVSIAILSRKRKLTSNIEVMMSSEIFYAG